MLTKARLQEKREAKAARRTVVRGIRRRNPETEAGRIIEDKHERAERAVLTAMIPETVQPWRQRAVSVLKRFFQRRRT